MDLGIITKEFLEEYFILLENPMYGNVDASPLCLRLLAKYLTNVLNLKRSKGDELIMSLHLSNIFVAGEPDTLKKIK